MIKFNFYICLNKDIDESSPHIKGETYAITSVVPQTEHFSYVIQSGDVPNLPPVLISGNLNFVGTLIEKSPKSWTWPDIVQELKLESSNIEIERKWLVIGYSPLRFREVAEKREDITQYYFNDGTRLRLSQNLKTFPRDISIECIQKKNVFPGIDIELQVDQNMYLNNAKKFWPGLPQTYIRKVRYSSGKFVMDSIGCVTDSIGNDITSVVIHFIEIESSDPNFDPNPYFKKFNIDLEDILEVTGDKRFSMRSLSKNYNQSMLNKSIKN